jgi:hypothetical protein
LPLHPDPVYKNPIKKKTKLYSKTKLYLVILGVRNPTVS